MTIHKDYNLVDQFGDISEKEREHVSQVKAFVKNWMIQELKQCIDNGEIEQDKLNDESNNIHLIQILHTLICRAWKELEIDINDVLLKFNYQLAIDLYFYLYSDFKLLSKNYRVNKVDTHYNLKIKKKILMNTIEVLKQKARYLEGDEKILDMYNRALIDFECKVDYHGNTSQLTALLTAMSNAKIHKILDIGVNTEVLIYPEILDLFKDYFYLKFAFESDKKRMNKLRENIKNNPETKLTPDERSLLIQLGFVQRGQESSYIRNSYEKKYMFEFDDLKSLLKQILKGNVKNAKPFASYDKLDGIPYMPLPLFKYTLLYGQ